jgi:limonene-1,2-epoxide hydrolase
VKAWKTAPKNVGNLMEKARRCGVYVGLAQQAVWRDDFDLNDVEQQRGAEGRYRGRQLSV